LCVTGELSPSLLRPYTAEIPHEIHSSTKAIVSTVIGMLLKDGVLDRLDHPVLDFFFDRHIANVDSRKNAYPIYKPVWSMNFR
jgi:CubicO group peptidase (beta-lactamase class C family)